MNGIILLCIAGEWYDASKNGERERQRRDGDKQDGACYTAE